MDQLSRTWLLPYILCLLLTACGSEQAKPHRFIETPVMASLQETLDTFLETNIPADGPGTAVLLLKDGELVYKQTRGMADNSINHPINSDTGFRLASISKTFTALAVMQLVEQGLLRVDDSVLDFLPELPDTWKNITLHHLLAHQSGIPDFTNDLKITSWPDGVTNQDILDYFSVHDILEFDTGSQVQYSNTGYVLLAEIIQRISGMRFADYMAAHIFQPLDLDNTYVLDEYASSPANTALNYASSAKLYDREFYVTGSSSVVSSLNDMQLFMAALLEHRIVSEQSLQLMLVHHSVALFDGADYGYGLLLDPTGNDAFSHTGSNDGFKTRMLINNDSGFRFVIFTNGGDKTAVHNDIGELIARYYQL